MSGMPALRLTTRPALALGLALSIALGGCVSSREVVITIHDRDSGTPIESAQIKVWRAPVFAKFGAQRVPSIQEGTTDSEGQWHRRVADGAGSIEIRARGYGELHVYFGGEWRWPESMHIFMSRHPWSPDDVLESDHMPGSSD